MNNEEKLKFCPRIELPGWWWKKYFKKYHIFRKHMQDIMEFQWVNGGYEGHNMMMMEVAQKIEKGNGQFRKSDQFDPSYTVMERTIKINP